MPTLWIWVVFRQLEAVDGHCGYDFPLNPVRWLWPYHGPRFHDMHHAYFKGNCAGFFNFMDRWCGTELKAYREQRLDTREGA